MDGGPAADAYWPSVLDTGTGGRDVGPTLDTGSIDGGGARDTGVARDTGPMSSDTGGGTCSPACDPGETCVSGACRCGAAPSCAGTQTCCSGGCVDTNTNAGHCGRCGNACPAGQTCSGGVCGSPCTVSCPSGTTCSGDQCLCGTGASARACAPTEGCCAGTCTRLDTITNCGACGRACAGGSEQCCAGVCRNTNTDVNNCGSCGRACDSDTANNCASGSCRCHDGPECLIACSPLYLPGSGLPRCAPL